MASEQKLKVGDVVYGLGYRNNANVTVTKVGRAWAHGRPDFYVRDIVFPVTLGRTRDGLWNIVRSKEEWERGRAIAKAKSDFLRDIRDTNKFWDADITLDDIAKARQLLKLD